MAMAVPPSVLYKQRSEGKIRTNIIKEDLVEAVILLPKKVYDYHTFNYAILVINRNKAYLTGKIRSSSWMLRTISGIAVYSRRHSRQNILTKL